MCLCRLTLALATEYLHPLFSTIRCDVYPIRRQWCESQVPGGRERNISAASRPLPVKGTASVAAISSANTRV